MGLENSFCSKGRKASDSFEFLRSHTIAEDIIAFQIPIGLPRNDDNSKIVSRPVAAQDVPAGLLYFGQLRGRTMPVAAARFAHQMLEHFQSQYECEG